MFTWVTGLRDEANILIGLRNSLILCGTKDSDLQSLIPPSCKGVISFGVCGSLNPNFKVGDVIVSYRTQISNYYSYSPLPKCFEWMNLKKAVCYSDGNNANTYDDKKKIYDAYGTDVIDDETIRVNDFCLNRGVVPIPYLVFRSVSDAYDQENPISDTINPDGTIDIIKSLKEIDPLKIPQLIESKRTFDIALANLKKSFIKLRPLFNRYAIKN